MLARPRQQLLIYLNCSIQNLLSILYPKKERRSSIPPFLASNITYFFSIEGDIELKNVDFTYPERPDAQIFDRLSLQSDAGKVLALVGPSN